MEINELATALAKVKYGAIKKDKTVRVTSRSGASYTFAYATLESIMSAIRGPLAEQGLTLTQTISEDMKRCSTMIMHLSGQYLESKVPLIIATIYDKDGKERPPTAQEMGSAISYARRYGISLICCLAPDEDDDANIADGNTVSEPGFKITPLDGAGKGLPASRKESLLRYADDINNAHAAGEMNEVMTMIDGITDNDEIMYLYLKLNSRVRAAIKVAQDSRRSRSAVGNATKTLGPLNTDFP